MKKVFYYGMTSIMIMSFVGFIYLLTVGSTNEHNPFYLMFMSMLSGIMAMMVEPGVTKEQQNKLYGILMLFVSFIVIIIFMTSCSGSRNGYGCHGKESWKQMERRINRGY